VLRSRRRHRRRRRILKRSTATYVRGRRRVANDGRRCLDEGCCVRMNVEGTLRVQIQRRDLQRRRRRRRRACCCCCGWRRRRRRCRHHRRATHHRQQQLLLLLLLLVLLVLRGVGRVEQLQVRRRQKTGTSGPPEVAPSSRRRRRRRCFCEFVVLRKLFASSIFPLLRLMLLSVLCNWAESRTFFYLLLLLLFPLLVILPSVVVVFSTLVGGRTARRRFRLRRRRRYDDGDDDVFFFLFHTRNNGCCCCCCRLWWWTIRWSGHPFSISFVSRESFVFFFKKRTTERFVFFSLFSGEKHTQTSGSFFFSLRKTKKKAVERPQKKYPISQKNAKTTKKCSLFFFALSALPPPLPPFFHSYTIKKKTKTKTKPG